MRARACVWRNEEGRVQDAWLGLVDIQTVLYCLYVYYGGWRRGSGPEGSYLSGSRPDG